MKKLLALVLALTVALCALTVTAFADETVVFDNPDGQSLSIPGTSSEPTAIGDAPPQPACFPLNGPTSSP